MFDARCFGYGGEELSPYDNSSVVEATLGMGEQCSELTGPFPIMPNEVRPLEVIEY